MSQINLVEDADKQEVKNELENMIDRLNTIINSPQIATITLNSIQQLQQAIKDEALYIKRLLKFIQRFT